MKMKRLVASMLVAVTAISLVACGNAASSAVLDDQAAIREFDPTDTSVYIDDEYTALIGSVPDATMTEAQLQRAAELRALAVAAFDMVNEKRIAAGLPALIWSADLEIAAQVRATEQETKFSHTRPNGSQWWTVNSQIMYGENLAKGYKTAKKCVDAWVASPTHNANLMDKGFVTCAIAIYEDANGKMYWAQEFGY